MSVYVSQFNEKLEIAIGEITDKNKELIDKIHGSILDSVAEKLRDDVVEYLGEAIKDDLQRKAAEQATDMLHMALCGNEEEIRNLFGINRFYLKQVSFSYQPSQFKLINEIVRQNPQLFMDERLKQLEAENKTLRKECERLEEYIEKHRH